METEPEDDPQSTEPGGRRVPFLEHLGIEHVSTDDGEAVFRVTVDERHLRTLGLLHGGVTATLLDTAMGMAARTVAPPDQHVVTVQFGMNLIRPAHAGDHLEARARVEHPGSKTAVVAADLVIVPADGEETRMALATGTFMFLPVSG